MFSSWILELYPQTVLSFPTSDCNCTSLMCVGTFWGLCQSLTRGYTAVLCQSPGHTGIWTPWGGCRDRESSTELPVLRCGDFGEDNQANKSILCSSGHTDWALPWFLLAWGWQGSAHGWQGSAHSCHPSFVLLLRSYMTCKTGVC